MNKVKIIRNVLVLFILTFCFVACNAIIDCPNGPLPDCPVGLTVTHQSFNSISLSWYDESGVDSFIVYKSSYANGPFSIAATNILINQFIVINLDENTKYYFTVSAKNIIGESEKSAPVLGSTISLYDAGYIAFLLDYKESMDGLDNEYNNNPLTTLGTKTYSLQGSNGGYVTRKDTMSKGSIYIPPNPFNPDPPIVTYSYKTIIYTWSNFVGSSGSLLNGILTHCSSTYEPGATGNLSLSFGGETGSISINCTTSPYSYTFIFASGTNLYNCNSYYLE